MFKTNFPGQNTIRCTKNIWGHCLRMPPVATGLNRSTVSASPIPARL